MTAHTFKNIAIGSGLVLMMTLIVWSPISAFSAQPAKPQETKEATPKERCQAMMKQKKEMMAELKVQDAELTEQVAEMNSASDDKKQELIAGVITQIVKQRVSRDVQMEKMHSEMMSHMMQHMQGDKDSMSDCPMMKGMMKKNKKSDDIDSELN